MEDIIALNMFFINKFVRNYLRVQDYIGLANIGSKLVPTFDFYKCSLIPKTKRKSSLSIIALSDDRRIDQKNKFE